MILFEAKSKQGKTDWFHVFSEPCGKKHIHTFNGLHRRVVRGRVGTGNGCTHHTHQLVCWLYFYYMINYTLPAPSIGSRLIFAPYQSHLLTLQSISQ